MTLQTPTRFTIEVHQPRNGALDDVPLVRVVPETQRAAQAPMAELREDIQGPAAFDPGECLCLDDADCNADHAND